MKYVQHNTIATTMPTPRQSRLQELQARLCEARELVVDSSTVKSDVGPSIYKVYDHKDNLVEWRQDSGWHDVE
jgi:hypothetical protein